MKAELMPFLLLAYIFSLGVLAMFAAIGVNAEAIDPNSSMRWLIGFVVLNVVSYVFTMTWAIDIAEARIKKDKLDDAE